MSTDRLLPLATALALLGLINILLLPAFYLYGTLVLRRPVEHIQIFGGPVLLRFRIGPWPADLRLIPYTASIRFAPPPALTDTTPPPPESTWKNLAGALLAPALSLLLALIILGPAALGSAASGLRQIFAGAAHPVREGRPLLDNFFSLLAHRQILTAAGVLAAKMSAVNLLFALPTLVYILTRTFRRVPRRPAAREPRSSPWIMALFLAYLILAGAWLLALISWFEGIRSP
jgi:hypothetical protein